MVDWGLLLWRQTDWDQAVLVDEEASTRREKGYRYDDKRDRRRKGEHRSDIHD